MSGDYWGSKEVASTGLTIHDKLNQFGDGFRVTHKNSLSAWYFHACMYMIYFHACMYIVYFDQFKYSLLCFYKKIMF